MEIQELFSSGLLDELVLENLSGQVVSACAAVSLLWAVYLHQDLLVVVGYLYTIAACLQQVVLAQLCRDAAYHRTT